MHRALDRAEPPTPRPLQLNKLQPIVAGGHSPPKLELGRGYLFVRRPPHGGSWKGRRKLAKLGLGRVEGQGCLERLLAPDADVGARRVIRTHERVELGLGLLKLELGRGDLLVVEAHGVSRSSSPMRTRVPSARRNVYSPSG